MGDWDCRIYYIYIYILGKLVDILTVGFLMEISTPGFRNQNLTGGHYRNMIKTEKLKTFKYPLGNVPKGLRCLIL